MIDTSTTEGKIAVMQAYIEGKKIEGRPKDAEAFGNAIPLWNWAEFDYRVKPEPKYVPYDSVMEVDRDKWITPKNDTVLFRIGSLDTKDNTICYSFESWINLNGLFEDFTYEDGTPCGKLADE